MDGRWRYGNQRKCWEVDSVSCNFSSDLDTNRRPHGPMQQFLYSTWNTVFITVAILPTISRRAAINLKPTSALKTAPGGGGCPMTSMGMLATNPQTETGQRIYSAVCPTRLKKWMWFVESRESVCLRGKSGELLRCFSLWKEDSGDMKKRFFDLKWLHRYWR